LRGLSLVIVAAWASGQALAQSETLAGCYRMQHRQERFVDGRTRDLNTDCVFEFEVARVWSRCHVPGTDGPGTDSERLYTYNLTKPGRIRVTPLDASTGKPRAATSEIPYRLDLPWMITTQSNMNSISASGQQPETTTTLWMRESGDGPCKPRGDSGLRVGNAPVSSLAFSQAPAGWKPVLIDPLKDKALGQAVNRNFFIGAFTSGTGGVVVLDDFRYGPKPIRETEFAEVRKRFAAELGNARLKCDEADRACALFREGPQIVYTELVNLRGRVAVVHAAAPAANPKAEENVVAAARTFVDQLRRENP
jgi:hypothetical protein